MRRIVLLPLLLLALLVAIPAATAAEAEEPGESALVEEAVEGCEEEPVCEEEAEEGAEGEEALPECALRSATAHAAVKQGRLKLTIGYTASEPIGAVVGIRYGSTRLGAFRRQLRRSGVLRFARPLGEDKGRRRTVRVDLDVDGAACPPQWAVFSPKR